MFLFKCRIPSVGSEERTKWILAIESNQKVEEYSFHIILCEKHFDPCLITRRKDRNILAKGALPTIFPNSTRYL